LSMNVRIEALRETTFGSGSSLAAPVKLNETTATSCTTCVA